MSTYKQIEDLVNSHYNFKEILSTKGFRIIETETLNSGGTLTKWINDESDNDVHLITTDEDSPCIDFSDEADIRELSKLDLIRTLHAGGDWKKTQKLVSSGAPLGGGFLSQLGHLKRQQELSSEAFLSPTERMANNPIFSEMVNQEFMRLEANKVAKKLIEEAEADALIAEFISGDSSAMDAKLGLIDWEELWATETIERWFVPDFICESRAHSLYARSGLGKSLVCQEIAICLAAGTSALGHPVQEPIKVLYIDNENLPEGDLKPRFSSMGFGPSDLKNLKYLSFPEIGPLNKEIGGKVFSYVIDKYQPDLVFFDTFSRFLDGDENLSKTAQEFYAHTGSELKKRGIAYVRIDHIGKKDEDTARGTSAKQDDVDLIWQMKEVESGKKFEMINRKARTLISEPRFTLLRNVEPLSHRVLSGIDWISLIALAELAETALKLIEDYAATSPDVKLGKTAVWEALKGQCKSHGITRDELWKALHKYQYGDEEVAFHEVDVNS